MTATAADPEPIWWKVKDVAQRLNMSLTVIYGEIHKGNIPVRKVGRAVRISGDWVTGRATSGEAHRRVTTPAHDTATTQPDTAADLVEIRKLVDDTGSTMQYRSRQPLFCSRTGVIIGLGTYGPWRELSQKRITDG